MQNLLKKLFFLQLEIDANEAERAVMQASISLQHPTPDLENVTDLATLRDAGQILTLKIQKMENLWENMEQEEAADERYLTAMQDKINGVKRNRWLIKQRLDSLLRREADERRNANVGQQ